MHPSLICLRAFSLLSRVVLTPALAVRFGASYANCPLLCFLNATAWRTPPETQKQQHHTL